MFMQIVWDLDPFIFSIGSFSFRYYTLCWLLAFISCYLVLRPIFRKEKISQDTLINLAIYVALGTMIGARLGHCLFYEPQYFLARPWEIILPFEITDGTWHFTGFLGLASHGAAIGIIISLLLFCRKYKMGVWDVLDKLGVVAPLGGFFIRVGNFLNSEIVGMETTLPWGVVFERLGDTTARHPAQLYEAAAYLATFFFVLWWYRYRRQKHSLGVTFGWSIMLIFLFRIIIEYSKEVQEAFEITMRHTIGLDMGQLLSLPFVVAGAVVIITRWKKRPAKAK